MYTTSNQWHKNSQCSEPTKLIYIIGISLKHLLHLYKVEKFRGMRNLSLSMDTIVFLTNDFFVFNLKKRSFSKTKLFIKSHKFHGYCVKHENARTEKLGGGVSNDPPPSTSCLGLSKRSDHFSKKWKRIIPLFTLYRLSKKNMIICE